jgi:hypothetical protein
VLDLGGNQLSGDFVAEHVDAERDPPPRGGRQAGSCASSPSDARLRIGFHVDAGEDFISLTCGP